MTLAEIFLLTFLVLVSAVILILLFSDRKLLKARLVQTPDVPLPDGSDYSAHNPPGSPPTQGQVVEHVILSHTRPELFQQIMQEPDGKLKLKAAVERMMDERVDPLKITDPPFTANEWALWFEVANERALVRAPWDRAHEFAEELGAVEQPPHPLQDIERGPSIDDDLWVRLNPRYASAAPGTERPILIENGYGQEVIGAVSRRILEDGREYIGPFRLSPAAPGAAHGDDRRTSAVDGGARRVRPGEGALGWPTPTPGAVRMD